MKQGYIGGTSLREKHRQIKIGPALVARSEGPFSQTPKKGEGGHFLLHWRVGGYRVGNVCEIAEKLAKFYNYILQINKLNYYYYYYNYY